jgi:hypothetical protein
LFCDGQYVDHGDNLDKCAKAIRDIVEADIEGYASAEAGCEGNACQAQASAGVDCECSALPGRAAAFPVSGLVLVALGWLVAFRRRILG